MENKVIVNESGNEVTRNIENNNDNLDNLVFNGNPRENGIHIGMQ